MIMIIIVKEDSAQLAERQIEWWQRIEDKRRAARRERELADLKEVRLCLHDPLFSSLHFSFLLFISSQFSGFFNMLYIA
jgi:hypothetical protein